MKATTDVPVLHSLRALAALSVCLFHFICTVNGFIDSKIILGIFSYGHYGVQMFFVISGFIIPWSMYHSSYTIRNYFTFAVKRFIRLEPPYIASLMVAIAHTYFRAMSPHYNGVDITPTAKQIALHFGYLIPFFEGQKWIRTVYWTLAVEFQYYLSLGLLFPLIANKNIGLRILSYTVILSGPVLLSNSGFLPYHLPVFLFGIILFLFKAKVIDVVELSVVTTAAGVEMFIYHDQGTLIFAAVAYVAILFFAEFKNKILSFFGDISYSIYLFHSLTGLILLNYFAHTAHGGLFKFVLVIIALIVTTGASYLVYRFIELPSKRLSSRIKYKKEPK